MISYDGTSPFRDDAELPALTRAEADMLDAYLSALTALGRLNPARAEHTYRCLTAAQALVAHATALRDAVETMYQRGETEIHAPTLARALAALDVDHLVRQLRGTAETQPP